jgi:phosphate transport system permease protein
VIILVTLAAVALFLITQSLPVLQASPGGAARRRGVPVLPGAAAVRAPSWWRSSRCSSPSAVDRDRAVHLALREPAHRARSGYLTDLLAAIPSVIYGLWGATVLAPYVVPSYQWLEANLGFIPLFAGPASANGRTILTAGLVLAVMILPIMAAINREVFLQTPTLHEEAALALGATRWEMIKMSVIPYGKSGVISGAMLGLGRALGETIAVLLVLSASGGITFNLIAVQPARPSRPTSPRSSARPRASTSTSSSPPGWCCSCSPSRSTSPPAPSSPAAPSSTEPPDEHRRTPDAPDGRPTCRSSTARCRAGRRRALAAAPLVLALLRVGARAAARCSPSCSRCLFASASHLVSRAVEGRGARPTARSPPSSPSMFAAAMVPLVSLLLTVVSRGAERFDVDFFTLTMRNVVGRGRRRAARHPRHAHHHRAGRRHLRPRSGC